MGLIETIEQEQIRHTFAFRPGDSVRVHVRIREGDKERIQIYEGVVISLRQGGNRGAFTVRKVSYGVGVERVFPLHSPTVEKVEVVSAGKVRRARLFYLRDRRGKKARIKERDTQRPSKKAAASVSPAAAATDADAGAEA